jgi:hypothetical protein
MLNKFFIVKECDATEDDSSNAVRLINYLFTFLP